MRTIGVVGTCVVGAAFLGAGLVQCSSDAKPERPGREVGLHVLLGQAFHRHAAVGAAKALQTLADEEAAGREADGDEQGGEEVDRAAGFVDHGVCCVVRPCEAMTRSIVACRPL